MAGKFSDLRELLKSRRLLKTPFYRKYRYESDFPLSKADSRGAVDFELGVFFNRIRKSANSTVATNLVRIKSGENLAADEAKSQFVAPSSLSDSEVDEFDDLFKFTFVRDPFSRTLSAYLDKIVQAKRKPDSLTRKAGANPSFREFCDYLCEDGLYENGHWAPQSELLLIPHSKFDLVGRVENFDSDFESVLAFIRGDEAPVLTETYEHNRTNATSKLAHYYDQYTVGLVARLFERDFEEFGYSDKLDLI